MAKKILCMNRRAPYGTVYALESLEVVLAASAFEQTVTVLFVDDGVYQLMKGQSTDGIEMKNFSPTYRALETYGVESVVVEDRSLQVRALSPEDLVIPVRVLSSAAIADLLEEQDVVLSF